MIVGGGLLLDRVANSHLHRLAALPVVVVKPHYLKTHVAYRKIWIEPRFDNHGGKLVEDTIEFAANTIPPVRIGETVRVYAVALEA